jgi:hypothetical protein
VNVGTHADPQIQTSGAQYFLKNGNSLSKDGASSKTAGSRELRAKKTEQEANSNYLR